MAQLCTNPPPITNSALNGSHLHQCPLTHSECTRPTQMKCSPYTLRMHSTNSNQVLSLHTQNALNPLKWRLTMLECRHMHIQCFEIPPKSTNPTLVHLQTWDGLQSFRAPSKFFKTPPRFQKRLQQCKLTPATHTNLQDLSQCTQAIKPLMMQFAWVGP